MKFQCGECDKYFTINNIHNANNDLEFKCDNCTNQFIINRNLVFSSSSKNSKIVCGNCGKLIPEENKACDSCNLILNKTHEELRIDNKDYELLEINANGDLYNVNSGKQLRNKKALIPVITICCVLLSIALAWYLLKVNRVPIMNTAKSQNASHIETQVVIMQSGQTYYADKVEKDGAYLRITNKDGAISKVLKSNVLQISKAVIEE